MSGGPSSGDGETYPARAQAPPGLADLGALLELVLVVCTRHNGSVTSWYRTPAYNEIVGGAWDSLHLRGLAVDVVYEQRRPEHRGQSILVIARWPAMRELEVLCRGYGVRFGRKTTTNPHDHFEAGPPGRKR